MTKGLPDYKGPAMTDPWHEDLVRVHHWRWEPPDEVEACAPIGDWNTGPAAAPHDGGDGYVHRWNEPR